MTTQTQNVFAETRYVGGIDPNGNLFRRYKYEMVNLMIENEHDVEIAMRLMRIRNKKLRKSLHDNYLLRIHFRTEVFRENIRNSIERKIIPPFFDRLSSLSLVSAERNMNDLEAEYAQQQSQLNFPNGN